MSSRPTRNPQLAWREIEGEIVIISPEDSQVHELNETAALVWKRADGAASEDEIAVGLAAEYEVSVARARADVAELIAQFREKQLLVNAVAAKP
jgi:hypothetical protein